MDKTALLDHLVGEQLQRVGHFEAEHPSRLQVDDELEFGRLQDRQVGGLRALEDLAGRQARRKLVRDQIRSMKTTFTPAITAGTSPACWRCSSWSGAVRGATLTYTSSHVCLTDRSARRSSGLPSNTMRPCPMT